MQLAMVTARRVLLRPWTGRAWRDLGFTALSAALNLIPLAILVLPWIIYVPVSAAAVLAFAFVPLAAVVALGPRLTMMRRTAIEQVLGVRIPAPPPVKRSAEASGTRWRALVEQFGSLRTWRQAYYHLIAGPAVNLLGVLTGAVWIAALLVLAYPEYAFDAKQQGIWSQYEILIKVLCVPVLYLLPPVVSAVIRIDVKLATGLLGPSQAERLALRVENLAESRAGAVDAADAERRRIERDLHDGAQQRLVSLAMNLGLARATMSEDLGEPARKVLREAHEEAKQALVELRELVRGLHPVVLEDRGLDAALSGVAARSPVPVHLTVDVPERPAPTIEAVGYFIVSEALANVAKHAKATRAEVDVRRVEHILRISITDDGIGGADASRGTGLTGLAQRAASVDGVFRIISPQGGPTMIRVELPCES
jgi:signal transduction histidine kinase